MSPKNYLLILVAALLMAGCKKSDQYPVVPVITFKSMNSVKDLQGRDDHLAITFSFTDGDGDIGIDTNEVNIPPFVGEYANNIHIVFYWDSLGTWIHNSQYDDRGRLRVITPEGSQKAIRGDIEKDPVFLWPLQTNLRIRYDIYIYDRALHKSNTITTPAIVVTTGPPH